MKKRETTDKQMKTPEELRIRAASLRQQAQALEQEAQQLESGNDQASWDKIQGVAQRALNGWDTARMRQVMQTVRELQTILMKLDWKTHEPRVRVLDKLHEALRLKSDKVEMARFRKQLYADHPGASAGEIEAHLRAQWDDFRRNL